MPIEEYQKTFVTLLHPRQQRRPVISQPSVDAALVCPSLMTLECKNKDDNVLHHSRQCKHWYLLHSCPAGQLNRNGQNKRWKTSPRINLLHCPRFTGPAPRSHQWQQPIYELLYLNSVPWGDVPRSDNRIQQFHIVYPIVSHCLHESARLST